MQQATARVAPAGSVDRPGSVILVGNPNVGKSVIFGHLTGRYVTVSNYPGTTVEVTRGTARIDGEDLLVIDTPGINTLIPQSEDEKVTRDIILNQDGPGSSHLLQVGDAKNLPRVLLLTLQLAEMGVPFLLCLNMHDEADTRGILIDAGSLASRLGVEVVPTVAVRRRGLETLRTSLTRARRSQAGAELVRYDERIEHEIALLEPLLPESAVSRRSLALMVLAGDSTLSEWLRERVSAETLAVFEAAHRRLREAYSRSVAFVISRQRMKAAAELARSVMRRRPVAEGGGWLHSLMGAIGTASMHPVLGMGFLAVVLYVMYLFVGVFGAGTAVDWLESDIFGQNMASLRLEVGPGGSLLPVETPPGHDNRLSLIETIPRDDGSVSVRFEAESRADEGWQPAGGADMRAFATEGGRLAPVSETAEGVYETTFIPAAATPDAGQVEISMWSGYLNPAIYTFFVRFVPWDLLRDLFVGPYGLITMGATYAIAIVLPIVATFFFAFSILEDSGYLPRLAIMLNKVFRMIGLNGKAVLPMVLGLGCDTMATLTTRILETRKERTIVILLLALGVPCSAQLGVILGMLAALSWKASVIWLGVIAGVIALVGLLASRLLPGRGSDFIMEVPPIRVPALANIATKTLARIEWYLREAVPLFLLGTLLLFVADRLNFLAWAQRAFSPLITGLLGLPGAATEAFLIGFLRRDFGSAGLYRLAEAGMLDPTQVVVALVTVTLFIPCIANFFMIVKEKGMTVALLVAGFIFPFALLVGGALNYTLRATGVLS